MLTNLSVVAVVVITPPLPREGGTARTAIQAHAVNLIEMWLGERCDSIVVLSFFELVVV